MSAIHKHVSHIVHKPVPQPQAVTREVVNGHEIRAAIALNDQSWSFTHGQVIIIFLGKEGFQTAALNDTRYNMVQGQHVLVRWQALFLQRLQGILCFLLLFSVTLHSSDLGGALTYFQTCFHFNPDGMDRIGGELWRNKIVQSHSVCIDPNEAIVQGGLGK